jgi:hypothetical protein
MFMKNYKEIISLGLFTFAVVLVLIGLSANSSRKAQIKDAAAVNTDVSRVFAMPWRSYDFGQISMAAGKVKTIFQVKNTSTERVMISKMYTSCMCTNAVLQMGSKRYGPFGMPGHGFMPKLNSEVQPGEEFSVEVIFDPAAHGPAGVGPIQRTVYVETSAGVAQLEISALVRP